MGFGVELVLVLALIFMLIYILFPVGAMILFSVATRWDRTVWPEGYTLSAYSTLFRDREFWIALYHSTVLALTAIALSAFLIVPALLTAELTLPRVKKFIEAFSLAPFVIPSVLFALGLVETYASLPIPLYGTPVLLTLANTVLAFPLMYRSVENKMHTIGLAKMVESAITLGARMPFVTYRVILPNLWSGIVNGSLLILSMVLSEFALANLMVGGSWPTLSVYLYSVMRVDGQAASVLSVVSFTFTWLLTSLVTVGGVRRYGLS